MSGDGGSPSHLTCPFCPDENLSLHRTRPTPVKSPVLVASTTDVLEGLLGLNVTNGQADEELAQYFSGNHLFDGSEPAAQLRKTFFTCLHLQRFSLSLSIYLSLSAAIVVINLVCSLVS